MAKPAPQAPVPELLLTGRLWLIAAIVAVLVFYFDPLFNPNTTPHWDAIDTHYSPQKYFADHVREGSLPFWTPYIFSGFPFLADPQVGAWYPLNWPFFLVGITPKVIQAELVLHALMGLAGMYLLLLRFTNFQSAAFVGAMSFAFGGYFADHAQHVARFCGPCWLPWMALFLMRALDSHSWDIAWLRWSGAAALAGGAMILAGDFQAALYSFYALALFGAGVAVARRNEVLRIAGFLGACTLFAIFLSAVMWMPGLELTANSIRAAASYGNTTERLLRLPSLSNLFWPNATDYFSGKPLGETSYYLYSGFLLLPLAVLGLRNMKVRVIGALLVVVSIWYMLGPAFGLYRLGAVLPALHKVRAPIHAWFIAVFGMALLAACGVAWLVTRFRLGTGAQVALVVVIFADLFYFNSFANPAAYERSSFDQSYGALLENTRQKVALVQPSGTRFYAEDMLTAFGPLNHPLDLHVEATYGYNPLILTRYEQYRKALLGNPKLLAGLNASRRLDRARGTVLDVPEILPRAFFAKSVSSASLETLDPSTQTMVEGAAPAVDRGATVISIDAKEQELRVKYRASSKALLRIAIPYFPGWQASVDRVSLPVLPADHAFQGVEVPAGEKELVLRYRSTYFGWGAGLSLLTLVGLVFLETRHAR